MKKIIVVLSIITGIVLACEPLEVDIKEAFNFEIASTYDSTNFISKATSTEIQITPEREVTGAKYFMTYENVTGEGHYKKGSTILAEAQEYELENLNFLLQYFGETVENHQVKITIRDSNDLIKEHFITYKIIDKTDFMLQISTAAENIYLTEEKAFLIQLMTSENELEEEIDYTITWSQTNIGGSLSIESESFNLFQTNSILLGNHQAQFLAEEFGSAELTFTVEASNGISQTQSVDFEVLQTTFEFTVIPQENSDYIKDFTPFNFNITKQGAEDLTYTMVFSGQNGEFHYNGNQYLTGQQITSISEGNFEMNYRANKITNEDITITITASNGVTRTIDVEYESLATNFEIVITPDPMSRLYVFPQTFEMSIIPPAVDDYDLEYTMYYTSTVGTVILDFHDIDIQGSTIPGIIFDFETNTYTSGNVIQIGNVEPRTGELTFYFTDSNGVTNSKTVGVKWTEPVFD